MKRDDTKPNATVRGLDSQLSGEELQEAEENMDRYLALALRIYERICEDTDEHERLRALLRKRKPKAEEGRAVGSV